MTTLPALSTLPALPARALARHQRPAGDDGFWIRFSGSR